MTGLGWEVEVMHMSRDTIKVKVQIAWEPVFIIDLFDSSNVDGLWSDGAQTSPQAEIDEKEGGES